MGDLSRWEINPYRPVIGLFSHDGDGKSGGKRSPQADVGQALRLAFGQGDGHSAALSLGSRHILRAKSPGSPHICREWDRLCSAWCSYATTLPSAFDWP